ncbi:MAG: amino acid dehydrogenase [Gemmatimonadota bacterium]
MNVFEELSEYGHEQVSFWSEPELGYRGIIAIHDTTLGPALGGTRFWNYDNVDDAIVDVLRLARGMTYKAAIAGVNLGGGKSVIIGDNRTRDREMIFRAHGRAVEALGGRYITAEDVGTSVDDMEFVRMETDAVVGLHGGSGDPSPVTAYGTYHGIRACAERLYGDPSLGGRHVTVQGVGHVGYHLCALLAEEGARLTVADIDPLRTDRAKKEFGARIVEADEIYSVKADVFAPCALGAVLNDETLPVLEVDIVAGAANNQLALPRHGEALHEREILYAPDYVINAGGLINCYGELHDWGSDRSKRKAAEIYGTLIKIFELADRESVPAGQAADRLAEERIRKTRHLHRSWV